MRWFRRHRRIALLPLLVGQLAVPGGVVMAAGGPAFGHGVDVLIICTPSGPKQIRLDAPDDTSQRDDGGRHDPIDPDTCPRCQLVVASMPVEPTLRVSRIAYPQAAHRAPAATVMPAGLYCASDGYATRRHGWRGRGSTPLRSGCGRSTRPPAHAGPSRPGKAHTTVWSAAS